MFNNVLQFLVSCATIGIADRVATDRLRDCVNTAGISDNSAEINDDATRIVDIAAKGIIW